MPRAHNAFSPWHAKCDFQSGTPRALSGQIFVRSSRRHKEASEPSVDRLVRTFSQSISSLHGSGRGWLWCPDWSHFRCRRRQQRRSRHGDPHQRRDDDGQRSGDNRRDEADARAERRHVYSPHVRNLPFHEVDLVQELRTAPPAASQSLPQPPPTESLLLLEAAESPLPPSSRRNRSCSPLRPFPRHRGRPL